jgi:hypothetical protein
LEVEKEQKNETNLTPMVLKRGRFVKQNRKKEARLAAARRAMQVLKIFVRGKNILTFSSYPKGGSVSSKIQ